VVNLKILHKGKINMALVSPGVEVTVIDEAQYLPAPTNSIPFILLATAQNKADPTSTRVAAGTTAANAGKLYRVTSQRDLVTLYGNPFFYTTSDGTPIQGYELNEYGLLAAYSALGVTNTVYTLRADIDLASLVGQTGRPTGNPADGTYWLDTTTTTWGIYEFDQTTGQFTVQTPYVISDSSLVSAGAPLDSIGQIGDYAVIAIPTYDYPSASTAKQYFFKTPSNQWASLGSAEWLEAWPCIQGTESNPTLTPGDTMTFNISGGGTTTVTVQSSPNNLVSVLAADINALGFTYLSAAVSGGKLQVFSAQTGGDPAQTVKYLTVSGTGTLLSDLGITPARYNQLGFTLGTSSSQPLWQTGQTNPRPTGSTWIKIGSAGNGFVPVISSWDDLNAVWVPKTVSSATSDWAAIGSLDSTGGKAIPAGTVYAQYKYDNEYNNGPMYYWERSAVGATVVTGSNTTPNFASGPYTFTVQVSLPGSSSLSSVYTVSLADNTDATDFVTAWSAAGIPFTTAVVLDSGAIQLSHTEGGVIVMDDYNTSTGFSNGVLAEAGFIANSTTGVKYGPFASTAFTPSQDSTTGVGTGLQPTISTSYGVYDVDPSTFANSGSGYAVGDEVTFLGTDLGGATPANDLTIIVGSVGGGGAVTSVSFVSGDAAQSYSVQLSNWVEFDMTANEGAPVSAPANNTNWFYSVVDQVDIMVNTASGWVGYKNTNYDSNGFPIITGSNATDPNGPIVSASEPTLQSDGTALVYGDLWIDTSDLENYPLINRWQLVDGTAKWVRIDNSNGTDSNGIIFQDARWAPNGTTNPANDPIPTIVSLLTSDYLDLDAPSNTLYPVGMMLFNTRRSGYNVKQYRVNYFNNDRFPDETLPNQKDAWVSSSGLQSNGAPYMGRKAQRAMVVQAMRAVIDTNTAIRDEDNFFNLMATPNYPELQPNMVTLNADRGETGFIIGDTPLRLPDDATAIQAWATNAAGATSTGEDGLVTRSTYMGLFYPSGIAPDLSGNLVAVPASHMMIRTFLRNDTVAYPWLAPAGTRRGIIDNATNIGYVNGETGEFITIKTRIGIRDVLYTNQINPMVFFTGNGLLNYGNKSSFNSLSALDRINVARLVAYIRRQLTIAARPFVFEPNDAYTRQQISGVVETLLVDLVAKRGVYDYLVVCDESNNTPARIDRNELWIDVAIEPVKAVEFIYVPVRIFNTGELSS
jgi:hypothetical protein